LDNHVGEARTAAQLAALGVCPVAELIDEGGQADRKV
jgi:hypothetical protein